MQPSPNNYNSSNNNMKLIDKTLNLIAANDCLSCGLESDLICGTCMADFCIALPSRCYICKKLTRDFAVCSNCRPRSRINNVWVATDYSQNVKKLVYELKYKSNRSAAPAVGLFLCQTLPLMPRDTVVVNIPTATKRVRMRGFDHSRALATYVASKKGLRYINLLARTGQSRQVGSNRKNRLGQLSSAFLYKNDLIPERALLIDDIVTTGATLESAAKELKQNGVKKVYALVFAQK